MGIDKDFSRQKGIMNAWPLALVPIRMMAAKLLLIMGEVTILISAIQTREFIRHVLGDWKPQNQILYLDSA